MGGNGKFLKWRISIHRSNSHHLNQSPQPPRLPPKEFICPICDSLMSDPVVVASGHTFDRLCVQVCRDLRFIPTLPDGSTPDFSAVITNLVFKSTIADWCENNRALGPPVVPDYASVERIVRERIERKEEAGKKEIGVSERELIAAVAEKPDVNFSRAVTDLTHRVNHFYSSSSEESVIASAASPPATPLLFATRPACLSPSSSSISDESLNPNPSAGEEGGEDEEIFGRLTSQDIHDQEQGVKLLRKVTRSDERSRISLCTARLLSALRLLLGSRYLHLQTDAAAAVVNLSLDKANKVKIVRSGIVPPLIDVLTGGFPESQEHAAGALFSLALDDDNKTAIGVLGALQPLLHALRSESERTRHDSALALYHLSHVKSNRVKLVKLGAVPVLLGMVKVGSMAGRVLLVVWNLANCVEGRSALLDGNAVEVLVGLLRRGEFDSESTRENCVAALYALSHGSLRFKGLAKEAAAAEVLKEVERSGSDRAREKARRILLMMRERELGGEIELHWEGVMDPGALSQPRGRGGRCGGGKNVCGGQNSSEF
ncbi:hypothetical protein Dimus_004804 [Dionaea muscipula]